ncbi:MAG: PKD domain-containing protein [Saprospiraceae bacterium]|nr:PKD domain-containing protein [Saprospiraceae bacterium]
MLLLLGVNELGAQCERVGWIASSSPGGCGAKIIDLDKGDVLRAVAGTNGLVAGQTISFSATPASLPGGCTYEGIEVVGLSCVSDTLPCQAKFTSATSNINAFNLNFEADIYDASKQICTWKFGDGATAQGKNVLHTFPGEGSYQVCLTVSDAFGCEANYCENVLVSEQNPNWCDHEVYVTAIGNKLYGKIYPLGNSNADITAIKWYDSKTNKILAETPSFSYTLPGNGNYLICAQYTVIDNVSGAVCTTTRCQQITLAEPGCVNNCMINPTVFCPSIYAPVCGCDGVAYGNECEAMSSGLSSWWAGDCSVNTGNCNADLKIELVDASPDDGFTFRFINLSAGDYASCLLDFGDSSPIWETSSWDTLTHFYPSGGIYRTNLTTWKTNGCISSATKLLITDTYNMSSENLPDGTDYVMPGDANGDKKANVYDLLNLGLGYGTIGAPRPNASSAWMPQFAPNWQESVTTGVNYKHLDCDGDGKILDFDADPIEQHYVPIDTNDISWMPGAPKIKLKFAVDTIYVNPSDATPLEISADVLVATPGTPVFDLYGLAFALKYPEFINHDPNVYYDDDLLGSPNHCLFMSKDNYDSRQLDLGFVRKNGSSVNGYGRIAKINFATDFIIIVDVIDRASNNIVPLTIPIKGLRAIDENGNIKDLTVPVEQDTVWIKLQQTTGANNPALAQQIIATPNPATNAVTLFSGDLEIEQVEAINTLGQTLYSIHPKAENPVRLDIGNWQKGLYTLRINTKQGMTEKRLLVK